MEVYDNEFKTKEKNKLYNGKIEARHVNCNTWSKYEPMSKMRWESFHSKFYGFFFQTATTKTYHEQSHSHPRAKLLAEKGAWRGRSERLACCTRQAQIWFYCQGLFSYRKITNSTRQEVQRFFFFLPRRSSLNLREHSNWNEDIWETRFHK